jgi:undecaprenyl-diphosphatase
MVKPRRPGKPLAAFVINPLRVRDLGRLRRQCRAAAAASGWEPLLAETTRDDRGVDLARSAVRAGALLLFAVGGDGTVTACAHALACTGIPLAIIPLGTANLAARALGVPGGLDAALAAGFGGSDRRIDLADADGMTFAAMAGIGIDAAVVAHAPTALKDRLGWPAYALSGVAHLPGRRTGFTIRLDRGGPLAREARCVVVANAGLLPGGFTLLPRARLDDGLLDVGILAPSGPAGWVRVARQVLSRRDDGRDTGGALERHQARRVEISAGDPLPREVDGEIIAPGRSLTVTVRPGALIVRVPPAESTRAG